MERTPYLRYLKECLQHAEDCKVFGADALSYRSRCLDLDTLPELSQVSAEDTIRVTSFKLSLSIIRSEHRDR